MHLFLYILITFARTVVPGYVNKGFNLRNSACNRHGKVRNDIACETGT